MKHFYRLYSQENANKPLTFVGTGAVKLLTTEQAKAKSTEAQKWVRCNPRTLQATR